jgi:hypothetical protein
VAAVDITVHATAVVVVAAVDTVAVAAVVVAAAVDTVAVAAVVVAAAVDTVAVAAAVEAVAVEAVAAAAVDSVVANRAVVEVETATPTEANLAVKTTNQVKIQAKATKVARNPPAVTVTKAVATVVGKRTESLFF